MSLTEAQIANISALLAKNDPSLTEPAYLFTYPSSGASVGALRKSAAPSGSYTFDFMAGRVSLPGGAQETLSASLNGLHLPFVRSVAVFFAPFESSIIFTELQQPQIHADSCDAWHFFNDIEITKMQLNIPGGLIPDAQNDIQIVASNKRYWPYFVYPGALPHIHFRRKGLSTTATYLTVILTHVISQHQNVIKVLNKDAANGMSVDFQSVEAPSQPLDSDPDWVSETGFPQNLAAGNNLIIDLTGARHFIRLRVQDQVAATHASFDCEFMGRA